MAFNAEIVKTKLADVLHAAEEDLAPYIDQIVEAVHGAIDHVHAQIVAFEQAPKEAPIGAVVDEDGEATTVAPAAAEGGVTDAGSASSSAAAEPAASSSSAANDTTDTAADSNSSSDGGTASSDSK